MYKALNGQAPSDLKHLIVPYHPPIRLNILIIVVYLLLPDFLGLEWVALPSVFRLLSYVTSSLLGYQTTFKMKSLFSID